YEDRGQPRVRQRRRRVRGLVFPLVRPGRGAEGRFRLTAALLRGRPWPWSFGNDSKAQNRRLTKALKLTAAALRFSEVGSPATGRRSLALAFANCPTERTVCKPSYVEEKRPVTS